MLKMLCSTGEIIVARRSENATEYTKMRWLTLNRSFFKYNTIGRAEKKAADAPNR